MKILFLPRTKFSKLLHFKSFIFHPQLLLRNLRKKNTSPKPILINPNMNAKTLTKTSTRMSQNTAIGMVTATRTILTWTNTRISQNTDITDIVMVMVTKNLTVSFDTFFLEAEVRTFLTDLFFCPSICQGYNQRYEKQSYGGYGKRGYGRRNQGNRLLRYFFRKL